VDIYFYSPNLVIYSAHSSSKDLLLWVVLYDYSQFGGTKILFNGLTVNPGDLKLPSEGWLEIYVTCDANSAEEYIRYIDHSEGWDELNRHRFL
jgi:hypothetical protein